MRIALDNIGKIKTTNIIIVLFSKFINIIPEKVSRRRFEILGSVS